METVSFEDIPYHAIIDFIAPQLEAKEFGALSMVSVYMRDIFTSNDVWKRLYINSLRDKFKITDKSIHVGPCIENHKTRKPVEEMAPTHMDLWYHGSHWIPPYLTPWIFRRSMLGSRCIPVGDTREISEDAYGRVIRNLPNQNGLGVRNAYGNARKHLCAAVIDFNQRNGHEHSHLCTNIDHYLLDTLDAPKSVRNYKDFRKQYLSKYLTQRKHDPNIKKAEAVVRRKRKKIDDLQRYIKELEKEVETENRVVEKNEKLKKSLALALNK
jgi:hypothetical protein